jgi:hypothetical protein
MAQQTAVEWLYNLSKQRELDKFDLEQAKAMEIKQMKESYTSGVKSGWEAQNVKLKNKL